MRDDSNVPTFAEPNIRDFEILSATLVNSTAGLAAKWAILLVAAALMPSEHGPLTGSGRTAVALQGEVSQSLQSSRAVWLTVAGDSYGIDMPFSLSLVLATLIQAFFAESSSLAIAAFLDSGPSIIQLQPMKSWRAVSFKSRQRSAGARISAGLTRSARWLKIAPVEGARTLYGEPVRTAAICAEAPVARQRGQKTLAVQNGERQ